MSNQYTTGDKIDPKRGTLYGPRGGISQRTSEKNSKSVTNDKKRNNTAGSGNRIACLEGDDVSMALYMENSRLRIRYKGSRCKDVISYIKSRCGRPTDIYDILDDVAKEFEISRL